MLAALRLLQFLNTSDTQGQMALGLLSLRCTQLPDPRPAAKLC